MECRRAPGWPDVEPPPAKIAIVRALQLGDLLCAVPLFRALRRHWPKAKVTLIALPWARSILDRFDAYIDDILEFPGWPGIPERESEPRRLRAFRRRAQTAGFDLAIQAHGDGRWINDFVDELGADRAAGFHPAGTPSPGPGFIPYPADRHESLRLLALAAHLGARELSSTLEFPLRDADHGEAQELRRELGVVDRPYACVHPGSSTSERRWPPEGFARVADELVDHGLDVVLTGTSGETDLATAVGRLAHRPLRTAVGRTTLGGAAALIAGARLLVTNDTGVSHLAAALGVPSVVVFTGSDPRRWAPLAPSRHLAVGRGMSDGHGGGRGVRDADASTVRPDHIDVIDAVRRQLAARRENVA